MATGFKKKTPGQVQTLEKSYNENKYPNQLEMTKNAESLGLTYNQVKTWFKERRRKERKEMDTITTLPEKLNNTNRKGHNNERMNQMKRRFIRVQMLYPKDFILRKVFRKDGPILGCDFDEPSKSLGFKRDNEKIRSCSEIRTNAKKRKMTDILSVSKPKTLHPQPKKQHKTPIEKKRTLNTPFENPKTLDETLRAPPRMHGMGKGLMTIWRTTNSENREFPQELTDLLDRNVSFNSSTVTQVSDEKKSRQKTNKRKPVLKKIVQAKRVERKKKTPPSKRKANPGTKTPRNRKTKSEHSPGECQLAGDKDEGQNGQLTLMDDEELELQELQVGPNPFRCSAHLSSSGTHGCALCKDLLAKFPPERVKMKQPFSARPWDSSPELVKKLFKVLRFLYTSSNSIDMDGFTIDEFVQSFHDKDSMIMGKVHIALLRSLLSDVEKGGIDDFAPVSSKDCRFLSFLTFFREQEFDVNFMIKSLNPLTWIEILRQVLIAAGFGAKHSLLRRENLNKNKNQMVKYGLKPRTLKGELFSLLSKKGSSGFNVSELAKSPEIMDLDLLSNSMDEIEQNIHLILSSDITLFEKISLNSYRLRVDPNLKGISNSISIVNSNSNSEDSGSLETDKNEDNGITNESDDEINNNSNNNNRKIVKCGEIDESYCGEAWVLGLMEGEYSDLRIDEKLDALIALVDLIGGAGSCLRFEDPIPKSHLYHGSGGKIKKSTNSPNSTHSSLNNDTPSKQNSILKTQTVYLGSDRRYNNYYLFLGPCERDDPGHRIVFFESSDDGHWEAIDSPQDLLELLLVLDTRGTRESRLFASLNKRKSSLIQSMEASISNPTGQEDQEYQTISLSSNSSPISDIDNNSNSNNSKSSSVILTGAIQTQPNKLERIQEFDKWVWTEFHSALNAVKLKTSQSYSDKWARCLGCHDLFWRDEKHCRVCHVTFELDFDLEEKYAVHSANCKSDNCDFKVHNSQLQVLKASVYEIEGSMPENALPSYWIKSARKFWVKRLKRTSSLPELLQVLVDFVGAIKEDWLYGVTAGESYQSDDIIISFQTMPQTTSALALWIVKLDSLISPFLQTSNSDNLLS